MKRILILFLSLTSLCTAQLLHIKTGSGPSRVPVMSDTAQIKSVISQVVFLARMRDSERISRYLSLGYTNGNMPSGAQVTLSPRSLHTDSINISIKGDSAAAEFLVSDYQKGHSKKEVMSFYKSKGRWMINGSTFFIQYVRYESKNSSYNAPNIGSTSNVERGSSKLNTIASFSGFGNHKVISTTSVIPSFNISSSALIQRTAPWTSVNTIDRSVTQQYLSRILFDQPYDGKFVILNNSDVFSIMSDHLWGRILYASHNGNWIKSYGDNKGDQPIPLASSVALDQSGNIFVIANYPPTVYWLEYNESSQTVSLNKTFSLPDVSDASDIDLATDSQGNETFWLTDNEGNAVFHYDLSGTALGKYTSVVDPNTNEQVTFVHPTSLLVNFNGYQSLALIDDDSTRVTIIDDISGFNGNVIDGTFTSFQFTDKVALSSLGVFGGLPGLNGLWVGDAYNHMFHVFDALFGTGYLCSVSEATNGQVQWAAPRAIISTDMSNSDGGYLEGQTLDNWDDSHGINTYDSGTDLLNVVASYASGPNVFISGTTPTATLSSATIYRPDGSSYTYPTNTIWASTGDVLNIPSYDLTPTIGVYHVSFQLTPYYGQNYVTGPPSPVSRDFYFALLPDGNIAGPSCGPVGSMLTFNVNPTSGSGNFSYAWYRQDLGSSSWTSVEASTPSRVNVLMGSVGFTLRCDITDNYNGNTVSIYSSFISSVTTSGVLSGNEIWSGNVTITGSVSIPSGVTLMIQPGTTVSFPSGASLTANGLLTVNGNSSSEVTFTAASGNSAGAWGSLVLSGSGADESAIFYAHIDYGNEVDVESANNVTIENCRIDANAGAGIYLYSSSNCLMQSDTIANTNIHHGILLNASTSDNCYQNVVYKTNENQQGAGI